MRLKEPYAASEFQNGLRESGNTSSIPQVDPYLTVNTPGTIFYSTLKQKRYLKKKKQKVNLLPLKKKKKIPQLTSRMDVTSIRKHCGGESEEKKILLLGLVCRGSK